jgi:hypothetical protein
MAREPSTVSVDLRPDGGSWLGRSASRLPPARWVAVRSRTARMKAVLLEVGIYLVLGVGIMGALAAIILGVQAMGR